jgi:hypothetical protein
MKYYLLLFLGVLFLLHSVPKVDRDRDYHEGNARIVQKISCATQGMARPQCAKKCILPHGASPQEGSAGLVTFCSPTLVAVLTPEHTYFFTRFPLIVVRATPPGAYHSPYLYSEPDPPRFI